MKTINQANENYKKLAALFPNAITETTDLDTGEIVRAIDKDILMQEISTRVVEGREERYQFTWPEKKKAVLAANAPIAATLRPVREESVGKDGITGGWDSQNLYIEGDNLDVLKLLRETYLGKIKVIFIDPPYNTGNDFIYEDDFSEDLGSYIERSGQYDDQGNRMEQNTESNGRFHTDWLNMLYPRLKVAKNLLAEDGTIFISIDDNELENLHRCCDEIFGVNNFVGMILWKKKTNGNNMGFLPPVHDYILCYARNIQAIQDMGYPVTEEFIQKTYSNPDNDPRGPWTTTDLSANHKGPYFAITNPITGDTFYPPKGRFWVFNEEEVKRRIADGRIIFGKNGNGRPVQKVFASSRKFGKIRAESWWDSMGMNADATAELTELFGIAKIFTHPKPSKLLYNIAKISTTTDSIILDFFSGSASTAHAIMKLNSEDEGRRRFIMVQLPEKIENDTEAFRAGYKNICEIGKERIRRAGKKIKEEAGLTASDLDIGFRVLRLDSSNMQDVFYNPNELNRDLLDMTVDNIKPDRTPEDLLFQVMLDLGVDLSSTIEGKSLDEKKVFIVKPAGIDKEYLVACFDKGITSETVTTIAKMQPYYAVFRDNGMASDSVATNFDQIFETYSPQTIRKVL